MKTFTIVLFFLLLSGQIFPQSPAAYQTEYPSQISAILAENIQYPREARVNMEDGLILLGIKIDESGSIDSISILEQADEALMIEVFESLATLKEKWHPDFLEGRETNKTYLMSFLFHVEKGNSPPTTQPKDIPIKYLEKEKPEKALDSVMELLQQNPYDPDLIAIRAEAFRQLGEQEKFQKDYLQAKYLRKEILAQISVMAFGIPRSKLTY